MCFSATASFTASAALSVIAVLTYRQVRQRGYFWLVNVTSCFAMQQFLEGLLWLTYQGRLAASWQPLLIYAFLFFAYLFWPTYTPLAILQLERVKIRRRYLKILAGLGGLVSATLGILLVYGGAGAAVIDCRVVYQTGMVLGLDMHRLLEMVVSLAYVISTVGAILISTAPGLPLLGLALALSYLIALYFYYSAFVSVWCFFAALLSLMIYGIVRQQRG